MRVRHEIGTETGISIEKTITPASGGLAGMDASALLLSAALRMPCGLAVYDKDARLAFVNDRFMLDLGLPRTVLPGIAFLSIVEMAISLGHFPNQKAQDIVAERRRRVAAGEPFGTEDQHLGGRRVRMAHVPLPCGGWLTTTEDVTEKRQTEGRIVHMAHHDAVTGLGNRLMLKSRFEEAGRRRNLEALLYIDLDGFKAVNDEHGQAVGDLLLRTVAVRMLDCVRETDFVGRFGGDEFIVLLSRTGRHDGVDSVALRILRALSRTFAIGDFDIDIGASIGSVQCYPEELGLDDLIRRADEALYQAKAYGRGRHISFERSDNRNAERFRKAR